MPNCLYFLPPGRVEVREFAMPEPRPGEALVEVLYSGVSPGTELRCLAGGQAGAPGSGFIPGYQCVGRVAACPDGTLPAGELVFLSGTARAPFARVWGGHVSHAVTQTARLCPFPQGLDPLRAVFAKLAAISFHGVQMAAVEADERVAVVGLGPVGFFCAQILHQAGHAVTAFDLSAKRVESAGKAGLRAQRIERGAPTHAQVAAPGAPDVIIDCTGVPSLLGELLQAGKDLPWAEHSQRGLRYVVQGSYPGELTVPYDPAFLKEATVMFPRDHKPSDLRVVLRLIQQDRIGLPAEAVALCAPDAAQGAYERLAAARDLPLSIAFQWR